MKTSTLKISLSQVVDLSHALHICVMRYYFTGGKFKWCEFVN